MLLNRVLEATRHLSLRATLLRRRARSAPLRLPLIVVPGMLGTRLVDARGKALWGTLGRLYGGPSIGAAEGAKPAGPLAGFPIVPGLYHYDVYGGLLRFLERVGGYRVGEDLFLLDYDWRAGVAHAAATLDAFVAQVRGIGDEGIDLAGVSTGGQILRYWLGYRGQDVVTSEGGPAGTGQPGSAPPAPNAKAPDFVRRVVHIGAPHRGTFDAFACLHRGFRCTTAGRRFRPTEIALYQTSFDAIPHPDERIFVDERGRPLELDLYDAEVWRRTGLDGESIVDLQSRLDRARRLHRALDRCPPAGDPVVIGAAHLPTPARVIVRNGRALVPPPQPRKDDPFVGYGYLPGDGELPESSMRALPDLPEERVWLAKPSAHHRLPSDPGVHRLLLEALLATSRRIPLTSLDR